MEEFVDQHNEPSLPQLLTAYAEALKSLPSDSKLSSQQALRVLRARDRVQDELSQIARLDDGHLAKLVELDLELKQKAGAIGNAEHLNQLRQSLRPSESAWWWYFEPPRESSRKPLSDRFDWLWNVGTVACLVLATSFITQTAKAFSTEGFDFLGTLSTIGQGAGLAFIAGGALTEQGKQTVEKILSSVKIPPALHAEATFGASLVLIGTAYGINQNLPVVGNWYFEQAQRHEKQGEWSQAFKSYKRASNFAPDDYKNQIALGFLYERLGDFDKAVEAYRKGTAFGIPEFLNAQARAMLMRELKENNWQGGIDNKVILEAEGLLGRADKSIQNVSRGLIEYRNKRLHLDITINEAIAKMAKIKSDAKPSTQIPEDLETIVNILLRLDEPIKETQSEKQSALTVASTVGKERAECFYQKAFVINEQFESSNIRGIDKPVQDIFLYYDCSPFLWSNTLSVTPDALLLENYQFLNPESILDYESLEVSDTNSLMGFLYYYPFKESNEFTIPEYANRIILIQDPNTWLRLANQLSQLIQKNYVDNGEDDDQGTVWRFLLSKDGQIISYFAYDYLSRSRGNVQSFITTELEKNVFEKLRAKLSKDGKLEFADFKVVLSPKGKVLHILPWAMAYPIFSENCKETCKNLTLNPRIGSIFQSYTPDLKNIAELSALQAVVTMNGSFDLDNYIGEALYYDEPAIFKLKVSSDGQIVDYQAINQVAIQRLKEKNPDNNLKISQFPKLQKPPYTEFRLEAKGKYWKFTPWSEAK